MAKAVLVIDMPENCYKCKLGYLGVHRSSGHTEWCCKLYPTLIGSHTEKPEWCPLKELPQKQAQHSIDTPHHRWAKNGWNACLNEILKEE